MYSVHGDVALQLLQLMCTKCAPGSVVQIEYTTTLSSCPHLPLIWPHLHPSHPCHAHHKHPSDLGVEDVGVYGLVVVVGVSSLVEVGEGILEHLVEGGLAPSSGPHTHHPVTH